MMLAEVVKNYFPYSTIEEIKPFGNGHINDTYKLEMNDMSESYILQKINTNVFTDPEGIGKTHYKLQEVIFKRDYPITIAAILPTADGRLMHIDEKGNAWRLTSFITDSEVVEVVRHPWEAYEAGNGYGWFVKACDCLDVSDFKESIKDFHRLSFRISQLDQAIAEDRAGRLESVKEVVEFFKNREKKLSQIEELVDQGIIPLRLVHNDTKINNLLFRNQKATAVIDLDTVGPGIIFFDYGDALRTGANTAAEDEKDLSKVQFNMEAFTAFTKGYLGQVQTILTDQEEKYFYLAPVMMTYIIAIRFLTDYLNGDVYFKTAYADHNLDRCKVQKKLIESMEEHEVTIKQVIQDALSGIPQQRITTI